MEKPQNYLSRLRRHPLLWNLALIAAIILAMAVAAHILMQLGTRHGARRTVPDLSGVQLDQAQRIARKHDLQLHINDSLFVPAYEGGIVLDQLPEGGVEVKPGRTVYITINSFRQKMVPVPYVAGRSLRQAKNMLEIAGLEIAELVYRADMATNYVLDEYCDGRPVAATSKIEAELGSGGTRCLDPGGRLLCMALALDSVYPRLRVYPGARRSPELQAQLLAAVDELAAAGLDEQELLEAASRSGGALGKKLSDLALVMGAFRAAAGPGREDPSDRLAKLLRRLPESGFARSGQVYVDGFTDFTGVEMKILAELLDRGADMTVCLTLDTLEEGSEVFELSRRTARRLLREARERGVPSRVETLENPELSPAELLAEYMLRYTEAHFDAQGKVLLYSAESLSAECELAAARAVELAQGGCRWRDIAVAVRGFEDYRAPLEAAFAHANDLVANLQEASVAMDRQEMSGEEAAQLLNGLGEQVSTVSLRLQQRFSAPRHQTVEGLIACFEDYASFLETLDAADSDATFSMKLKRQTLSTLNHLKGVYDALGNT